MWTPFCFSAFPLRQLIILLNLPAEISERIAPFMKSACADESRWVHNNLIGVQRILTREKQGRCRIAHISRLALRRDRPVSMGGFDPGRLNTWNLDTSSEPSPSRTAIDREAQVPWTGLGASVNAISFGFMATAILISLFLIMAIFEHLFRPSPHFTSLEAVPASTPEAGMADKLRNPHRVSPFFFSLPIRGYFKLNPIVRFFF